MLAQAVQNFFEKKQWRIWIYTEKVNKKKVSSELILINSKI